MEFVGRYLGRAFIAPIAILRFSTGCSHCGVRSLSGSDGPRGDTLGPADTTIQVSRALREEPSLVSLRTQPPYPQTFFLWSSVSGNTRDRDGAARRGRAGRIPGNDRRAGSGCRYQGAAEPIACLASLVTHSRASSPVTRP